MIPRMGPSRDELLAAIFSEEPAPDIQAVMVVAHAGDECIGASWLLSRLSDRLSVFRAVQQITPAADAITLTGLPAHRCHSLGLAEGTLSKDLETLTWLVAAAVRPLNPQVLVTHAIDGVNLDHDAIAFAAQLTSLLLPRFGAPFPVLLEFQCRHDGPEDIHHDQGAPDWERGVRIEFGPDSRRLKEQILRTQLGSADHIQRAALGSEVYRPQSAADVVKTPQQLRRQYSHSPDVHVRRFLSDAAAVARSFAENGLIAPA
ncbi:MAG TPA: hypothetical protein VIL32_15130 [Steroidobacteraceae bacterium]|jgi:hypothetical protein